VLFITAQLEVANWLTEQVILVKDAHDNKQTNTWIFSSIKTIKAENSSATNK